MDLEDSNTVVGDTYRVECVGSQFIVVDPAGEIVNRYNTEDAALQDIERCKKEDAMFETGKTLIDLAIKAHMQRFGIDRETAVYWIRTASEVVG